MADRPVLSKYALCELEDVREMLGYEDDDTSRDRTVINNINAASRIIARTAQRDFIAFPDGEDPGVGVRWARIEPHDLATRVIRLGDIQGDVTEVAILTPEREEDPVILTDDDFFLLPDVPEAGMPFEYLQIKSSVTLSVGYWLKVTATWGFEQVPDDIRFVCIATASAWVLSDILKRTELGDGVGQFRLPRAIPSELEETVWSYRTYRVA